MHSGTCTCTHMSANALLPHIVLDVVYFTSGSEDQSSDTASEDAAGFYVYDLGSTHGTYLNKQKVRPRAYCRLRIGQMVKFGGSTRLFILEVSTSKCLAYVPLGIVLFRWEALF